MKKNTFMRVASALLVAVLLTTCAIAGTFAKYTTEVSSEDSARVAYWGFQRTNTMDITGLFSKAYDTTVGADVDVIAPGTSGSTTFQFKYDETNGNAPEVAYTFEVKVDATIGASIEANPNILWSLDGVEFTHDADNSSWDKLIAAIEALDGNRDGNRYEEGELPEAFGTQDNTHSISWRWVFSNSDANDTYDTAMGNAAELESVSIKITITATQID